MFYYYTPAWTVNARPIDVIRALDPEYVARGGRIPEKVGESTDGLKDQSLVFSISAPSGSEPRGNGTRTIAVASTVSVQNVGHDMSRVKLYFEIDDAWVLTYYRFTTTQLQIDNAYTIFFEDLEIRANQLRDEAQAGLISSDGSRSEVQ